MLEVGVTRVAKTLTTGYIPAPPGQYKDVTTNEVTGFDVDAARFITEAMGVKANFIETKWATFAAGLQAGQFDLGRYLPSGEADRA